MAVLSNVPSLSQLKNKFSNIEALIFDMDGTLLNSEVLHAKALHLLLEDAAHVDIDFHELLQRFKGLSEPDVLAMLIDKGIVEQGTDIEGFIEQKNAYFEKFLEVEDIKAGMIYPEMINLLKEARAKKLKVAIVTASERTTTDLFINNLGIRELFDIIITRDDTEKTKPDPMPYLHSFEKLSLEPEKTIIFEDSDTGHAAAVASGGNVLKVNWYEV